MLGERGIVPRVLDAFLEHCRIDVFDVHGLDTVRIVSKELHRVHTGPRQVPDVGALEDQLAVDHGEQAVDLFASLDRAADVVVEAAAHALRQRDLADLVQRLGELLELGVGHCVLGADVRGDLVARYAGRRDIRAEPTRSNVELGQAGLAPELGQFGGPVEDRGFLLRVPESAAEVAGSRLESVCRILGDNLRR